MTYLHGGSHIIGAKGLFHADWLGADYQHLLSAHS